MHLPMTAGLLVALLLGQAQAVPAPEAALGSRPPPPFLMGVAMGAGRRLDPAASDVPPTYGLQFSTLLGRRYLLVGDRLELGGAFHFAFQRYARDVTIPAAPGTQGMGFDDVRTLTYYDLTLQQTFSLTLGRFHPFAAIGGGLTMGHFATLEHELAPGEARANRPVARASAGLDMTVAEPDLRVGLEVDYARVFHAPVLNTTAGPRRIFGNRLGTSVWGRFAF
jgi:hypothetical protein